MRLWSSVTVDFRSLRDVASAPCGARSHRGNAQRSEWMQKFWAATVAAAIAACLAGPAFAQDGKADWAKIVAAAEREGTLVLMSQPNQVFRNLIQTEWPKAYPKIALSVSVVPEQQFLTRIRVEREADKYLWDMGVAGASAGYILSKDGIVDPLLPEIVDAKTRDPALWGGWDEAFYDRANKYVLSLTSYIASPWFNTAHVSPAKVAQQGFKLLLDPEYKGKIAWHDPTVSGGGRNYIELMRKALGESGFKRFVQDQATIVAQQHQVVEEMARDTAWIGIGPPVRSLLAPYAKAGVHIDVATFGRDPAVAVSSTGGSTVYVFNRRPHPNATRVFLNWLLSRDMQFKMATAMDQRSRREDVPETGQPDSVPIKGAKYFAPQREENLALQEKNMALVRELRSSSNSGK